MRELKLELKLWQFQQTVGGDLSPPRDSNREREENSFVHPEAMEGIPPRNSERRKTLE